MEEFESSAQTFGNGRTFLDRFHMDIFSNERETNLHYPFASKQEWELAQFLLRSSLSLADIDNFLSLNLVRC